MDERLITAAAVRDICQRKPLATINDIMVELHVERQVAVDRVMSARDGAPPYIELKAAGYIPTKYALSALLREEGAPGGL